MPESSKENLDLSESLLKTLKNSKALELITEIGEVGIDLILKNEILKEIPILSLGVNVVHIFASIHEQSFVRKVLLFLTSYNTIEEEFKINFIQKLESNQKHRREIGEHITNALARFDQVIKADALGKIFAAYVKGELDYEMFMHYSYALDKIDFHNINILKEFYYSKLDYQKQHFIQNFAFVGLISIDFDRPPTTGQLYPRDPTNAKFSKNEFGEKFLQLLI